MKILKKIKDRFLKHPFLYSYFAFLIVVLININKNAHGAAGILDHLFLSLYFTVLISVFAYFLIFPFIFFFNKSISKKRKIVGLIIWFLILLSAILISFGIYHSLDQFVQEEFSYRNELK